MKKGITITGIVVAIGAALVLWLGGFLTGEPKPTEPKFDLAPEQFHLAAAYDRTQGLYEVQYWLVQRGPWPNPSLLSQTAKFYYKETPTLVAVKEVVRIPDYISKRKYTFCEDCPVIVKTLRPPVREDVEEEEPEKEPLPEKPVKTPPAKGG